MTWQVVEVDSSPAVSRNRSSCSCTSLHLQCLHHDREILVAEPRRTACCHSSAKQLSAANESSPAASRASRTSLSASRNANCGVKSPCAMRWSLADCHGERSGPAPSVSTIV